MVWELQIREDKYLLSGPGPVSTTIFYASTMMPANSLLRE